MTLFNILFIENYFFTVIFLNYHCVGKLGLKKWPAFGVNWMKVCGCSKKDGGRLFLLFYCNSCTHVRMKLRPTGIFFWLLEFFPIKNKFSTTLLILYERVGNFKWLGFHGDTRWG